MKELGGLTPDDCAHLRTRFQDILGVPVDSVRGTQRGLEIFVPLGTKLDERAIQPFRGAQHTEVVYTDADLGKTTRSVVLLPWSGLRAADRMPRRATSALAGLAILALAYQVFCIL